MTRSREEQRRQLALCRKPKETVILFEARLTIVIFGLRINFQSVILHSFRTYFNFLIRYFLCIPWQERTPPYARVQTLFVNFLIRVILRGAKNSQPQSEHVIIQNVLF